MAQKKVVIFASVFLFLMFVLPIVLATQPTQQYNKIFLNPFYRENLISGVTYNYSIFISPPDGFASVQNAIIGFNGQINGQSQNFTLMVNNKSCTPASYYIATAYSTTGNVQFYFDCSNAINKAGFYTITLRSAVNTGAMVSWLDLTYINNPSGSAMMGGTEYTYGQTAMEWIQVINANNTPINTAVCYMTIYTPLGTVLINNALMTNTNFNGLYTYSLAAPIVAGVYPVLATCYYTAISDIRLAKSYLLTTGTVNTQTIINNTWILDGIYLSLKTDGGAGNNRINATFNFSDYYTNCGNVSEVLMTGFSVYWSGVWNTANLNHDIQPYVYNYSSSSWVTLTNKILGGSGTGTMTVTNSFSTTNITKLLGVNSSNPLLIKFADNSNSEGTKDWKTDYLYASCDQLGVPTPQIVRGSSEMHISSGFEYQSLPGTMNVSDSVTITLSNGTNVTDDYYTGIFISRFSVQSGSASVPRVAASITVYPFGGLDCDSILDVFQIENNSYTVVPGFTAWNTASDQCALTFETNVSTGSTSYFEVHARNRWESVLRDYNTMIGSVYPLLDGGCKLWQITHGYPAYITPKNHTNTQYDYYYRACANWYDNYYWFNSSYYQALTDKAFITGLPDSQNSFLTYEGDFFSSFEYGNSLDMMTSSLIANLGATNDFSNLLIANPLGDAVVNTTNQRYWADVSSAYQTWKMLNASCGTGTCKINGSDVWNYPSRNLTYTPPVTIDLNAIATAIWNFTSRNLTYYPTQVDLTNYTLITELVWNYVSRNLTYIPDLTNYGLIQIMNWNATNRNLTYYPPASVDNNAVALAVWNFTSRNLTYYPPASVDNNAVALAVWNFTNRNLTYYNLGNNLAANDVWNYISRNLTYYEQVDLTNYSLITENTWSFSNRTLTYYEVNNITPYDIWNYANRTLTQNVSEEVWLYYNRTLTYYPDVTNYTLIGDTIWQYTNRSLTENIALEVWTFSSRNLTQNISAEVWTYYNRTLNYYPDVTDYSLIYSGVWNFTNRNLTYYPTQLDLTNYSLISDMVWVYTNRSLTVPVAVDLDAIAASVWNYTHRNLTYIDFVSIALNVWNATDRNLTYYQDAVNYTLNAETVWNFVTRNLTYQDFSSAVPLIWNYTNRNLTYYADMTNYLLAAENIWNYTNRNLTYIDFITLAANVWNATTRNLTYYSDATNYTLIGNTIWEYPSRNLTYLPPVTISLDSIASIWNYTNRTLTYYEHIDTTNYTLISEMVWNYIDRNLTYIPDMTNYLQIQNMVWNATDRNLTFYPTQFDLTNYTLAAQMVWAYVTRNLTYTPDMTNYNTVQVVVWNVTTRNLTYYDLGNNLAANEVWNYTTRNLTYAPDMTNYSLIFLGVWNATNRNLTYYQVNNITASDVWNYFPRNLTYYEVTVVDYPLIAGTVWNFTIRNLTYYEQVDLTDYSLIAQVVWNFTNRNLTYYNVGNNLSASEVWNFVSRNLTYYQDVANYTQITENTWSFSNRTLTYYEVNNISTYDIWTYGNRSLTQNLSEEVWLYYNRTLTYIPDSSNYSLTAQTVWDYVNRSLTQNLPLEIWTYVERNLTQNISYDVWTYYNKTLTYYPDITNYSLINQGVWDYGTRNLTYYQDVTNYTQVGIYVWGYTGTINSNILNQIAAAIWNYVGSIANINNQIATNVWQFSARYTHGEIID